MRKFTFSFKSLLVAAGLLLGSANAWGAGEAKGAYKVVYDFETTTGFTIHGKGYYTDYGDGFGKVFHNGGGDQRTHYLQLPASENLLWHSNVSKEITIGFWVSAKGMVPSDYTYAPFFSAYAAAPSENTNTFPMFILHSRGVMGINNGGVCDFGDNLCTGPVSGTTQVYNTNAGGSTNWFADNKWHYYTVTMTESKTIIYLDGVIKNQWEYDNTSDGQLVKGIFDYGGNYTYVCLGGNQAWAWGDNDMPFSFDDFMVTNEALDATGIEAILDAKVLGIAQTLYDDATYFNGKSTLLSAINTLKTSSSAANRTALYTAIDDFRLANASYSHPYSVTLSNADFANGADDWNASNISPVAFTWGHDGTWNRWLENFSSKIGDGATGITSNISISQTIANMPAGHYTAKAYIASRGYTSNFSISDGTTPASMVIPASEFTQRSVDYDLSVDGSLTISFGYTAGGTLDTRCEWIAIDDVELTYYGDGDPTVSTTLDNSGYATFASPYALDLGNITGATAYKAAIDGSVVRFTELSQTVNPNEGILLKGDANAVVTIPVVTSGTDVDGNAFLVNTSGAVFAAAANTTYFAMYKNQPSLTFAKFTPSTLAFPANKAYLKVVSGGVKALQIVFGDDEATGITVPEAEEAEEGVLYNIAGQQVTADFKGIVIKKGKKYFNK